MSLEGNVWNKNNAAWRQINNSGTITWSFATKDVVTANVVISTDGTFADNSDTEIASQKAVKTYADTKVASSTLGVTAIVATTSLPASATVTISSIPAIYSYLVLQITGWSQDTNTARLRVRMGTSSVDSTAANYVGNIISGTTVTNFTTNALASMVDGTTQTVSQTGSAVIVIHGYQAGPHKRFESRILANTTESQCFGTYIGAVTAIDMIEISTSAAGAFDAGSYALYGYR